MPSTTPADTASPLIAARDTVAVCDASPLSVLAFDGPDATAFLHGQLSSDVAGLGPDACQYATYNTPAGRMLADLVVWRAEPEAGGGLRALLSGDIAAAVRQRLARFVLRSKLTVTDVSSTLLRYGVGGPEAGAALHAALGAAPPPFGVARTGGVTILALPGSRYLLLASAGQPGELAAALPGARAPAAFAVWQWLTIRAGVPTISAATQDKFVPQTANWDLLGGVSFRKGCYPGQEIVARSQYLGRLKERLFAFRAAPAGAVAPGLRVYSAVFADQPCGTVVNAAPAPEGDVNLLAVVQLAAAASGDVRLGALDGPRLEPLTLPYDVPQGAASRPPAGESTRHA